MTITEKTVYVAGDGTEHPTRRAAEDHEAMQELAASMREGLGPIYEGPDFIDIARWLIENYGVTPRPEEP